jgi:hypothetical protein
MMKRPPDVATDLPTHTLALDADAELRAPAATIVGLWYGAE